MKQVTEKIFRQITGAYKYTIKPVDGGAWYYENGTHKLLGKEVDAPDDKTLFYINFGV